MIQYGELALFGDGLTPLIPCCSQPVRIRNTGKGLAKNGFVIHRSVVRKHSLVLLARGSLIIQACASHLYPRRRQSADTDSLIGVISVIVKTKRGDVR